MRLLFLLAATICSLNGMAQCKSFKISAKGDTLNCIDQKDQKQGKWVLHVDPLRGNPGYEEEGEFVNNLKEGIWRRYSTMGDLVGILSYRWGNFDGLCQYYTVAGLEREESWKMVDPSKAYDTLEVPDLNDPNKYITVYVKNEGKSMKHGTWKWYRPGSMTIINSKVYILNREQTQPERTEGEETAAVKKPEPKKEKPKEVEAFEKKNGKKTIKVRDGKTGG